MTPNELEFLRAEEVSLAGFLEGLATSRVIERLGVESRLTEVRQQISALEEVAHLMPKRIPVTFGGEPVNGNQAINAEFAVGAMKLLIEATNTVAVALSPMELKNSGSLPGGWSNGRELMITRTIPGSFGFELELSVNPQTHLEEVPAPEDIYTKAIKTTFRLLDLASHSNEDGLSEIFTELPPRAAKKVRDFAAYLSNRRASFSAEFENERLSLSTRQELMHVLDALDAKNISEDVFDVEGVILGVLPQSRRFECQLLDGSVIEGKIDKELGNLTNFKQTFENAEALLTIKKVTVSGKTRHVLLRILASAE